MKVTERSLNSNVSWNVFLKGLIFAKNALLTVGIELKPIHYKKSNRPTLDTIIFQKAVFLVGIFLTHWQFCILLEQLQDRRVNALCSLFSYWANPAEMPENSDLNW